jgi:hypothetical protein
MAEESRGGAVSSEGTKKNPTPSAGASISISLTHGADGLGLKPLREGQTNAGSGG